jgi:methylaspartate ammonia-lyase
MKIKDVVAVAGRSGFFNRDLAAVKAGARADGFAYPGAPLSPGFKKIVQPGTAISVMLLLDDGQVAFGDCVDVILSGVAGRDPLFQAEKHLEFLRTRMRDQLRGRPVDRFRALAEEVDGFTDGGRRLHPALRYGISQALLHAAALADHCTMAEIVSREYGCTIAAASIPILASCHKEDAQMIDRMILKRVELLPHASFQQVERDIGLGGEKLIAYTEAVVKRIREIGDRDYLPRIHLDVYGTLSELFGADVDAIAGYLGRLEAAVKPHELLVESFVIAASREAQIDAFRALRSAIAQRRLGIKIVVDEWCNTLDDIKAFADAGATDYAQIKTPDLGGVNNSIEAVLYARRKGMGCCLGGTGNETDQSARITAQIALAC